MNEHRRRAGVPAPEGAKSVGTQEFRPHRSAPVRLREVRR